MLSRIMSPEPDKITALRRRKVTREPVAALTAYDYPTARILDEAGIDLILVGDSASMVVMGFPDTTHMTMTHMLHHLECVRRGVARATLLADLPYRSDRTPEEAAVNARRLAEAGADAVKIEGGREIVPQIEAIRAAGVAVVGHLGMLPQRVLEEGGYKKKGKTPEDCARLAEDAAAIEAAGVCAIVLESMADATAARITRSVSVPTIGIGSGPDCDGQILVVHDLVGAFPWWRPRFAPKKADVGAEMTRAIREWIGEVKSPRANL